MRKSLLILLAFVASLSCQRRDNAPLVGDRELVVQSTFDSGAMSAPQTRATSTAFESGDQVGLFMVDFVNGAPAALKTTGNQVDNVCFTSNSAGLLTTNPAVRFTKDFAGKTDIYAYYPYDKDMLTKNVNAYNFKVQEFQTVGTTTSDFCMVTTTPSGIQPSPAPVRLLFEHKLAKIEVTLNVPKNYKENLKIKDVRSLNFVGIENGVTVNLGTGVVTKIPNSEIQELKPYVAQQGSVSESGGTPYVYHMIAPAQTYPLGSLFIRAILEFEVGPAMVFDYNVGAGLFGNLTTVAGKVHRLDFSIDPGQKLSFKGITITDWVEGPNVDNGELKEAISTEFSVSQQSFAPNFASANRVKVTVDNGTTYDITTGVSVAARVCKFKFTHASGAPREYGFKIVNLEFLSGKTSIYSCKMISPRVYDSKSMNLGLLPFNGAGTLASPYLISNAAELDNIRTVNDTKDKYFRQTASIDLAPYLAIGYKAGSVAAGGDGSTLVFEANATRVYPNLGSAGGWDALPGFAGSYDGDRYIIGGVIINQPTLASQGLFGSSLNSSQFLSIVVKDSYIRGTDNVGGVTAFCKGLMIDCHMINGVVKDANTGALYDIGGVVGAGGTMINCSNGATIYSDKVINTGGVAGSNINSFGLYNIGKVTSKVARVGGVVGTTNLPIPVLLSYSYNRGNVAATAAASAGAILGVMEDVANTRADNCYWLSTATYAACGPNGYGTSIPAALITNFAAMTAANMQNTNRNDPASLLYKLNKGPVQWVIAPTGHWNAGWPIPNPNSYTVGFYSGGVVAKEGATVAVEVIVPAGTSWTATSTDAAVATITSGASGTSRGVVTVSVKANAAAARIAIIKITSTKGSSEVKISQAAGV